MSQLLPTVQARRAQESLTEYLRTTFALADRDVQAALDRFLSDPNDGIFKGPFIRTRTPFKPQPGGEMLSRSPPASSNRTGTKPARSNG